MSAGLHDLPWRRRRDLRIAGIYLFGAHAALREDFFTGLTMAAVQTAFRRQARRHHPDLQGCQPSRDSAPGSDWFLKIKDSYEILKDFLKSRPQAPVPDAARRCRIIAVAGAKGGVGAKQVNAGDAQVTPSAPGQVV